MVLRYASLLRRGCCQGAQHNTLYHRSLAAPSALFAGLQLLTESYVVLIHAFLGAGNVQGAVELYKSMQRQGYDVRAGWLMLTSELFRHGCATAGGKLSREMLCVCMYGLYLRVVCRSWLIMAECLQALC